MRVWTHHVSRILMAVIVAQAVDVWSAAADETKIEVGAPIPATGPYASDGKLMEQALRLAIKDINAAGGVNGHPVSIRIFDIGDLTPDKLQAAAADLVERNHVAALINGYGGMGPDIPAFCSAKVPYLNNNATTQVVELTKKLGCNNIFMAADVDATYGKQTFAQLKQIGLPIENKTIAILHGPYDWEVNNTRGLKAAAEADGWKVVMDEEVPYGMNQWGGLFLKLRSSKPQFIAIETLDPSSVITFLDQFKRTPLSGSVVYAGYVLSTNGVVDLVKQGGLDGVLGMTLAAQRPGDAKGEKFEKDWMTEYHEAVPLSTAGTVYDEAMAWAEAANIAKDAHNYDAVKKALEGISYAGVTGTIKFNPDRYVPTGDDTQPPMLLQVQKGVIRILMVGSKKTAEFQKPAWLK